MVSFVIMVMMVIMIMIVMMVNDISAENRKLPTLDCFKQKRKMHLKS